MALKLKLKSNPTLDLLLQIRPPVRIKKFLENPSSLQSLFPMQLKQMSYKETKEYHLKKLYQLSLKSIGQVPQQDDLNEEKKEWYEFRMKGNARSWERWFVGHYFTEEQKKELGLTDEMIGKVRG